MKAKMQKAKMAPEVMAEGKKAAPGKATKVMPKMKKKARKASKKMDDVAGDMAFGSR